MGASDAASIGHDQRRDERREERHDPSSSRQPLHGRPPPRASRHSAGKAPMWPPHGTMPSQGAMAHPPGKSTSILSSGSVLSEALAVEKHAEDGAPIGGAPPRRVPGSSSTSAPPPAAARVPPRPQRPVERPPTPPWAQALRANAQERWSAFEAQRSSRNAGFLAARFVSAAKPPSSPEPTAARPELLSSPALAAAAALRSPPAVLPRAARPGSGTGPQQPQVSDKSEVR